MWDEMNSSNASISNSELKQPEVSLKSYVKDILDRIDRNQHSHNMQISNIKNLVSKMSIQIAQIGAGNMKPSYEGSIGREIEKMKVETLVLGSRSCEFDHELEKVEVVHKMFDEMPKVNFGVGHKVFDEMPKGNVNPVREYYVEGISGRRAQVCDGHMLALKRLKQVTSVEEYHDSFTRILYHLRLPLESQIGCFIDGLKEEIQWMLRLFNPQTIHEAYCLAKLNESTLEARKPKEPIRTTPLPTQNIPKEEYSHEHTKSVDYNAKPTDSHECLQTNALTLSQSQELNKRTDFYAINTNSQAFVQSDAKTIIHLVDVGEAANNKDVEKVELEDVEEQENGVTHVVNESPQDSLVVTLGVINDRSTKVTWYLGKNKLERLCDTCCMQDVFVSLEGDKSSYDFQKDSIVPKNVWATSLVAQVMNKSTHDLFKPQLQEPWKFGTGLIIAESFEWKPGWLSWMIKHWWRILHSDTYGTSGMTKRYVTNPRRKFRTLYNIITDDMLKKGLLNVYNNFGIEVCLVGAKLDREGQKYVVDCYVKMVNFCYDVDTRGVVKGVKTGAEQAVFYYDLGLVGDCFPQNVKVLFGLVKDLLKLEKHLSASGIDIPFRAQVNNASQSVERKSNVFSLLNCDEDSKEMENQNFVCSCLTNGIKEKKPVIAVRFLCSLIYDVKSEKVLQVLVLLQLPLEINKYYMEVQFSGKFGAFSQVFYADILKSQPKLNLNITSKLVTTYGHEELVIKNRSQAVDKWLVKWKWKKLHRRKMDILKIGINSLDPWGQGSFKRGVLLCVYFEFRVLYVIFPSTRSLMTIIAIMSQWLAYISAIVLTSRL
ncbi:hypothetical protein CTI12_AA515130 [Artemisia annua]|uniref:Uncharacterized protein n=1 Tax=Artemisia annua TaxID=35608 RepID=A0A2U1L5M7_ARTAN|nr:hypothetical protein CTI12_AA515130 [Artemisia annua]